MSVQNRIGKWENTWYARAVAHGYGHTRGAH